MESKKRKFNALDVIVLLVILAGLVFVLLRFTGLQKVLGITDEGTAETYVITFSGDEVPNFVIDHLETGAPITDDECKVNLGTVLDWTVGDPISYQTNDAGQLVASSKPNYSSIKLMSQVQAVDNGNGISIDGSKFGIGHTMVVRAGDTKMFLYVYDIQKISESAYANAG